MNLAVALLIMGIIVFVSVSIKLFTDKQRNPAEYNYASSFGMRMVAVLICTFMLIVCMTTYLSLISIKENIRENLSSSLNTALDTTKETLNIWLKEHSLELKQIASQPGIIRATERLILDRKIGLNPKTSIGLELFDKEFQRNKNSTPIKVFLLLMH